MVCANGKGTGSGGKRDKVAGKKRQGRSKCGGKERPGTMDSVSV